MSNRIAKLITLVSLGLTLLVACASDKAAPGGTSPVSGRRTGQVIFAGFMLTPTGGEADMLAAKDTLASVGAKVSPDGKRVDFDIFPTGWPVKLGDEIAFCDAQGRFTIDVIASVERWTLFDPSRQPPLTVPWASGLAKDLVAEGQTPPVTRPEMLLQGGCGMNPASPKAHCAPSPAAAARAIGTQSIPIPPPSDPQPKNACCAGKDGHDKGMPAVDTNVKPKTTVHNVASSECQDHDGPALTGQGADVRQFISYWGSTCYKFVQAGCCPHENGTLTQRAISSIPGVGDDLYTKYYDKYRGCTENHHGRWCQDITLGDLVISPEVKDSLYEVQLGGTIDFSFHNNGCFGFTNVQRRPRSDGSLPLGRFERNASFDGLQILHEYYGPPPTGDVKLTYTADRCITDMKRGDLFGFTVDATYKTMLIDYKRDGLWRFTTGPNTGKIFHLDGLPSANEAGCAALHIHGANPCDDTPDPDTTGCGHGQVEQIAL